MPHSVLSPREAALSYYDTAFVSDFRRAFAELAAEKGARFWTVGPTAYLFSLSCVKFAVDLQIRRSREQALLLPNLVADTAPLSFVLITHSHDDHMCLPVMQALKDTPIRWYLPADCRVDRIMQSGLSEDRIVYVRDGDVFCEGPLTIRAFYSPHVAAGEAPFPQCGYEITDADGRRILMPADVRDYTYDGYPDVFGPDLCFSHLWGGSDSGNADAYEPMLMDFAAFSARFGAKQYALCHLYEIARAERDLWHDGHALIAAKQLARLLPHCHTLIPRVGRSYAPNAEQIWEEVK